jgi:hypothetical protein
LSVAAINVLAVIGACAVEGSGYAVGSTAASHSGPRSGVAFITSFVPRLRRPHHHAAFDLPGHSVNDGSDGMDDVSGRIASIHRRHRAKNIFFLARRRPRLSGSRKVFVNESDSINGVG